MKRLLMCVLFAASALATTVNVTVLPPTGGLDYPFTLHVVGSGIDEIIEAACISPFIHLVPSWTANLLHPPATPQISEEAWLLSQEIEHPTDAIQIQHAIWNLNGTSYTDADYWLLQGADHIHDSLGVLLLDAQGASQNFLGNVPEPVTTLLTGLGLVMLSILGRRKRG